MTCLEHKENRSRYRHKLYAATFTGHVREVVNQLIRHVCKFIEIWEPEELELPFEITERISEEDGERRLLYQAKRGTRAAGFPSVNHIFITVEKEWFEQYVKEELQHSYYYYNAEITEQFEAVRLIRSIVYVLTVKI